MTPPAKARQIDMTCPCSHAAVAPPNGPKHVMAIGDAGVHSSSCSPRIEFELSLQIGDLQGDFDEMQGDDKRRSAESCQLSIAWMKLSLLGEQGAVLV